MIIAIVLRLTGAFVIWYVLTYGLSGRQKDPVSHGRRVAAWVAASAVGATPSMHRNGPDLAVFILINVLIWGGVAFVVGYAWRKFRPISTSNSVSIHHSMDFLKNKWMLVLGVLGLIGGLLHPSNTSIGIDVAAGIAFAVPFGLFFA